MTATIREIMDRCGTMWTVPQTERDSGLTPERLAMRHVPPEFRNAELSKLEVRWDPKRIDIFSRSAMTLVYGGPDAGKTTLATALFRVALLNLDWIGGFWVACNRMIIEAVRESKLGAPPRLLARFRACDVALLDDLGQEPQSDDARALIEDVISERHRMHRKTIVTTALNSSALEARYGGGVARRLGKRSCAIHVEKPRARP